MKSNMVLQIITNDDDGPKDTNDAASIFKRKLFITNLTIWQIDFAYKCKCADAGGSDRVGLGC